MTLANARASASSRTLALGLASFTIAACLTAAALTVLNWDTPTPRYMSFGGRPIELLFALAMIEMPVLGALIVISRSHPMGWQFLWLGAGMAPVLVALQYAQFGLLTAPGTVPGAVIVAWLTSWIWAPLSGLIPLLLLAFPTGHLPSSRWRLAMVASLLGVSLQAAGDAMRFPALTGLAVESPLPFAVAPEVMDALTVSGSVLWSAGLLAAAIALVMRARRARGIERQQLKWFVLASAFAAGAFIVSSALYLDPELGQIAAAVSVIGFLGIPTSAGLAILRYRLYDIDVLINRTLVYGALTAVLGATYFSAVVFIQAALRPFTSGSELAVAGSTLLVVALFQPLRRRVQDIVDRRFYRSRYDAARTLDAFGARLRDQVELDAVHDDLVGVVHETIRPAHASVWLRERAR